MSKKCSNTILLGLCLLVTVSMVKIGCAMQNQIMQHSLQVHQEDVNGHKEAFKKYVEGLRGWFNALRPKTPGVIAYAAKWGDWIDDYAASIAPVSKMYFSDSAKIDTMINVLGTCEHVNVINSIIDEFKSSASIEKTDNRSRLIKIAFKKHIESVTIPPNLVSQGVSKERLMQKPMLLESLVKESGKIGEDEYFNRVTIGLFARYWLEKVHNQL